MLSRRCDNAWRKRGRISSRNCSCAVAAFLESLSGQEAGACPFSVNVMQQLPRLYYEMDRFHSEWNGLCEQPAPGTGGLGDVALCKLLSGPGYRLRATSKIGKVTRGSNVLAIVGVSLAQACRAVRGEGRCLGPRKRRSGGIGLAFRLGTRNDTRQGQCRRTKPIRRIVTNDPGENEAPFRPRIASKGHRHEASTTCSGWRSTPTQCASSAMGRFVSMPHPAHT